MKALFRNSLIVLLFFVTIGSLSAQTIRIANNNPGAPGGTNVYTGNAGIQNAIDASTAGDIIHVIPSSIGYSDITVNKGVSIYGIGTNPDKEGTKQSQLNIINIGSSNVVISGMRINNYIRLAHYSNQTNTNILVENCYIANYILAYYSATILGNVTIRNNVLDGITSSGRHTIEFHHNTTSNISITNNIIIVKDQTTYGGINVNGGAVITNNLFLSNGGDGKAFADVDGSVIKNNIFLGCSPRGISSLANNTYSNNLTYLCPTASFPIGVSGNVGDTTLIDIDPQFVDPNVVPRTSWSFTWDHASLASEVLNGGDDGTDIGLTGGAIPYKQEATNLPLIQSVTIPSVIIQGNTLPTTIKAKGN